MSCNAHASLHDRMMMLTNGSLIRCLGRQHYPKKVATSMGCFLQPLQFPTYFRKQARQRMRKERGSKSHMDTKDFIGLTLLGGGTLACIVLASVSSRAREAMFFLLVVGALCFFRRVAWDNIIACVLCVYGLGLYHYYVVRSGPTSYAVVCLPAVTLIFWVYINSACA